MNNTERALNYADTFEDIKKLGGNTAQIISSITLSSVKEIKDAIEFYSNEINFSSDDDYKVICNNQKDLLLRIMIAKVRLTADLLNISGVTKDIEQDLADLPTITIDDIKANKAFDKEAVVEERKNKGKVLDMKGKTITTFDDTKKESEEKVETKSEDKKENKLSQKEIDEKVLSLLRNPSIKDNDILNLMRSTLGKANYIGDKNMSNDVVPARKWAEREIQTYFNGLKKQVIEENLKIDEKAKETKKEEVKTIPIDDSLKEVKPEVKVETKVEEKTDKKETETLNFSDVYSEGTKKIHSDTPVKEVMDWFVALILGGKVPSIKLSENNEFQAKCNFYSIFSSVFNKKQQDEAKAVVDELKTKEAEKWNDETISADLIEVAKKLNYKEDGGFARVCKKLKTKYNPLNTENKIDIHSIKDQLQPLVKEHNTAYWEAYMKIMNNNTPLAEKAEITAKEEKKSDSPSEVKDSSSEKKVEELKEEVVETGNPTTQEKNTSSEEVTSQEEVKVETKQEEVSSPETKNDIPEQKADTSAATPSENVETASKEEVKSTDVQPEKNSENTNSGDKVVIVGPAEPTGTQIASYLGILKNEKELKTVLDNCGDYKKMTELTEKLEQLSKGGNFKDAMSVLYHYTITKNQIEDFKDMDMKQVETFYKTNFHDKALKEINEKREKAESEKKEVKEEVKAEETKEETTEKSEEATLDSAYEAILLSKDKKEFQKEVLDHLLTCEIKTEDGSTQVDNTKLSMLVTAILDRTQSSLYGKYTRRISRNSKGDVYKMINNIYKNFKNS